MLYYDYMIVECPYCEDEFQVAYYNAPQFYLEGTEGHIRIYEILPLCCPITHQCYETEAEESSGPTVLPEPVEYYSLCYMYRDRCCSVEEAEELAQELEPPQDAEWYLSSVTPLPYCALDDESEI